ncbi:DUF6192 family protein [Streptomyces olivaceiscleroticus]|uniref:DUF6192 family protein n=1 Tax=Streptomyces olivaceiscleroticus TaxID=68245 RepID=UPI0031F7B645
MKLVHAMTRCQFAVGDAALEIAPLRSRGGDVSLGEDELGVEGALRIFAEEIGLSFHTVRAYRWVAARWPADRRQEGVSFEVHRILASAPDAFERIKDPPVNERTGRRQWSGDAANWVTGWATATPVTVQEKVESIRGLTVDETVAVQGACELLQRLEVAMRDRQALTAFLALHFMPGGRVQVGDSPGRAVSPGETRLGADEFAQ